jgi:hypothetical protein
MNKDDMILFSVDDHIVEPPDMFKNHLPKRYIDDAPRLVHHPDGSDTWQFRDTVIPNVALNAVAGRPKEEYGLEPQGLDEIRLGCWQVDERATKLVAHVPCHGRYCKNYSTGAGPWDDFSETHGWVSAQRPDGAPAPASRSWRRCS